MNPGGLINNFGMAMVGAFMAGDIALGVADASWVIEGGGGAVVLGRYTDGYIEIGGVVGASTFGIPTAVWQGMTPSEQLWENRVFLQAAIDNDTTIIKSQIRPLQGPALA